MSDMYDVTEIHLLKDERENSEEKVDEEDKELAFFIISFVQERAEGHRRECVIIIISV